MRNRAAFLLVAALACVAFVACTRGGADWRILQLYAGETTLDVLKKPTAVQAFRVDARQATIKSGDVHVGPFVATTAPLDVPADAAAELSKILSDADSFDWPRSKSAVVRPQIGLLFVQGSKVLEIALDLESSQEYVFAAEQTLGWQSVDPARARLVVLAKRLFPVDPVIRGLR